MNKADKKPLYFSAAFWTALSLIAAGWALFYFTVGHYAEDDKNSYEKLVNGENENNPIETHVSKQRRSGLQKNMYFNDNYQRLEFKVNSGSSELALERKGRHLEVVEHLHDVVCWLQESVSFVLPDGRHAFPYEEGRLLIENKTAEEPASWIPADTPGILKEQIVLKLTAENAVYHYNGGLFEANNVNLWRYKTSESSFEEAPPASHLMTEGAASKVEFSLGGKGVNFKADNFKAKFFMNPGVE